MPSLHFGTSLLIRMFIAAYGKQTPLRVLAPLYPLAMLIVVLATANHWVLDCVADICIVVVGWQAEWLLLELRPIEEWGFWVCRTEKPRDTGIDNW